MWYISNLLDLTWKFLNEFSSFSSEVFPSILKITQNTYRGQWAEPEGPGKDKSYQYLLGNLQNGERVTG